LGVGEREVCGGFKPGREELTVGREPEVS